MFVKTFVIFLAQCSS